MPNPIISRLLAQILPGRFKAKRPARYEPPALSPSLDIDGLHSALRQAEGGDTRNLFSLYREMILGDNHFQTEFSKRKMKLLSEPLVVTPQDSKDPAQVELAKVLKERLAEVDGWFDFVIHLLDASLYPVSVGRKFFKPSKRPGVRYDLDAVDFVPYHLLDFTDGRLRLRTTDPDGLPLGYSEILSLQHVVHRGHLLRSFPDNWGGPMRAGLFWWLFKMGDREMWIRFLERFGAPFIVGRYDPNKPEDRYLLEDAFSSATRLFGLVVNRDAQIEMKEASMSGADAFERFHKFANAELSKLIVGQTMLTEATAGGIGGTQANVHERVFEDIVSFDNNLLGETLREQVIKPWMALNGIQLPAPTISYGEPPAPEAHKDTLSTLKTLHEAGLEPTDAALPEISSRVGFQVQRVTAPQPVQLTALSADLPSQVHQARIANEAVWQNAAPKLAKAFTGSMAPVREMIRLSASPADLERRLRDAYADYSPGKVEAIIQDALTACAANGLLRR